MKYITLSVIRKRLRSGLKLQQYYGFTAARKHKTVLLLLASPDTHSSHFERLRLKSYLQALRADRPRTTDKDLWQMPGTRQKKARLFTVVENFLLRIGWTNQSGQRRN